MMNFRTKIAFLTALAVVVGIYTVRTALQASRDLVTLDVRNMEVRKVIRKLERQTWETIYLGADVQGQVTLNVRKTPLEGVLQLIAGQVSARSSHIYPVYQNKKSLKDLRALVQLPTTNQMRSSVWTNFSSRDRFGGDFFGGGAGGPGGPGGGGGPFGRPETITNTLVSINLMNKEASSAARALSFATQSRIITEDGIQTRVNLFLTNASKEKAVEKLAERLHAKVENFYLLQGFPREREMGGRPPFDPNSTNRPPRSELMAARLENLTPEQRARMEEMRNLTPEERQAQMQARMEDPAMQQRMADRMLGQLRNSTPEQIIQQKRERMRRMENFQQRGGTNGPGQGPGRSRSI